jgi:uncharacterized protein (TIGR02145 family)
MKNLKTNLIQSILIIGMLSLLLNCSKEENDTGNNIAAPIFNSSLTYGTLTDQEGNTYKTITIGSQIWMAENLRTTKFNDGTPIPLVTDRTAWSKLWTPAYSWCDNDQAKYEKNYGAIYNWHTVNTGKLSPTGWHVPSAEEWNVLINYLGGDAYAGNKLKEVDTTHWGEYNKYATNSSGFTALPAGFRDDNGSFYNINYEGTWWSSSKHATDTLDAYYYMMNSVYSGVNKISRFKKGGHSVRCIKD